MNELTATPTHASVLYLRLGDFATKPVVEQSRLRAQLEAVVAAGLSVLPEQDRIVLDTPDGIALVVLGNALGALKAAERCLDAAAVLPLSIGAGHGAVATVAGNGSVQGMLGDGVHSAGVAAAFAAPSQLLTTHAFREAVAQQEPVRQADLVRAGTFSDSSVRTHELFVMDRLARRRRWRRLMMLGAGGVVALLVAGGIGRLAYRAEGPFAPRAEITLAVSPGGEVFLDGKSQGSTPPLTRLSVRRGAHVVEIRNGDAAPFRSELQLKPGEQVTLSHVFTPLPQILFDVAPGGEILVDGAARGAVGSVKRLEVAQGKHTVEIRYGAHPPYRGEVTLKRGEQVTIRHVFTATALLIRVVPGGQLFVDGKALGSLAGAKKVEVVPGRHVVEVRYGRFPPFRTAVEVKAGQQVEIRHQFKAKNFIDKLFRGE